MATYNPFKVDIPLQTLIRLPSYLSTVDNKLQMGEKHISSSELGAFVNLNNVKVRQDLSYIGVSGKPRTGYNLNEIKDAITHILGYDEPRFAILVGNGPFNQIFLKHNILECLHLNVDAIFIDGLSLDEAKELEEKHDARFYNLKELRWYCASQSVDLAILDTEKDFKKYTDLILDSGIKAIWNFTGQSLVVPEDVFVQVSGLRESLGLLWYKLNNANF